MHEVVKFSECFVCGDNNECGLKARFWVQDDGSVTTEYTVSERFVGYSGILHGGIVCSLLDEVMIKAVLKDDILTVTAGMELKFKKPVYVGQKIELVGRVISTRGRLYKTEGEARVGDDIVATATGTYVRAKGELADTLRESLQ